MIDFVLLSPLGERERKILFVCNFSCCFDSS